MADKRKRPLKRFYLSWVDANDAPWVACGQTEGPRSPLDQERHIAQSSEDARWPGIPQLRDGAPGKLMIGPTLIALFHDHSPCIGPERPDQVWLLYDEAQEKDIESVKAAIHSVASARGIDDGSWIQWLPVPLAADKSDGVNVQAALERWTEDDPLERRNCKKKERRLTVNLTSGSKGFREALESFNYSCDYVKFVEVNTDAWGNGLIAETELNPIRDLTTKTVPQGEPVLTAAPKLPKDAKMSDPNEVMLEDLEHPAYVELRNKLGKAADYGLKVLLKGSPGTGKTFLAQHYHRRGAERRQNSAKNRGRSPQPAKPKTSDPEGNFVKVPLAEYCEVEKLHAKFFGWRKGFFTGATENTDGLLGEANGGTLFLDEIHHLLPELQAALLGPMNDGVYRPNGSPTEVRSVFDLVVATNDWDAYKEKMSQDFRDRIQRIVIDFPKFDDIKTDPIGVKDLWRFWESALRRCCQESGVEYVDVNGCDECRCWLDEFLQRHAWTGNWRDFQRLADHVVLHLAESGDSPGKAKRLAWNREGLDRAAREAFPDASFFREEKDPWGRLPRRPPEL